MSKKHGVTALKSVIHFVCLAVKKFEEVDQDRNGKLSLIECLNLITALGLKIPGVFKDIPMVKAEWLDLDDAERAELVQYFQAQFSLEDAKAEEIVELAIEALSDVTGYVSRLRRLLKPADIDTSL